MSPNPLKKLCNLLPKLELVSSVQIALRNNRQTKMAAVIIAIPTPFVAWKIIHKDLVEFYKDPESIEAKHIFKGPLGLEMLLRALDKVEFSGAEHEETEFKAWIGALFTVTQGIVTKHEARPAIAKVAKAQNIRHSVDDDTSSSEGSEGSEGSGNGTCDDVQKALRPLGVSSATSVKQGALFATSDDSNSLSDEDTAPAPSSQIYEKDTRSVQTEKKHKKQKRKQTESPQLGEEAKPKKSKYETEENDQKKQEKDKARKEKKGAEEEREEGTEGAEEERKTQWTVEGLL